MIRITLYTTRARKTRTPAAVSVDSRAQGYKCAYVAKVKIRRRFHCWRLACYIHILYAYSRRRSDKRRGIRGGGVGHVNCLNGDIVCPCVCVYACVQRDIRCGTYSIGVVQAAVSSRGRFSFASFRQKTRYINRRINIYYIHK